jgi:hypothetical protein
MLTIACSMSRSYTTLRSSRGSWRNEDVGVAEVRGCWAESSIFLGSYQSLSPLGIQRKIQKLKCVNLEFFDGVRCSSGVAMVASEANRSQARGQNAAALPDSRHAMESPRSSNPKLYSDCLKGLPFWKGD